MKKATPTEPAMTWRITLRPGMSILKTTKVKVFRSPAAFDGYVGTLRFLGIPVLFTSPFIAHCQSTQ
jgi:hypothetical protein